jgi:hypothetical protein
MRMLPRLSRARSAPVKTAITPGALSAAETSMSRRRALACIERTMTAYVWPGTATSDW